MGRVRGHNRNGRKEMVHPARAIYMTAHWAKVKRTVWRRAGGLCEDCGVDLRGREHLGHVHHLTYARAGAELPEDLQLLCAICHGVAHNRQLVDYGPEMRKLRENRRERRRGRPNRSSGQTALRRRLRQGKAARHAAWEVFYALPEGDRERLLASAALA